MNDSRAVRLSISSGVCLVGAAFLVSAFAGAGAGDGNLAAGDTPDALPRILLIAWVGLALADIARQLLSARSERVAADPADAGLRNSHVGIVMAVSLALAIAIVFLGYLVPIVIALPLLLYLTGTRAPVAFAASFLLLGPGLWLLFHHLLGIRLPILMSGGLF
ncbi:tripartite tricarboxylate transporter TctB family protein [Jiella mangrovi]|uniref:Tripartite tricarboxylate transporter TctB family protein n=1 Tax=Jiella mangrovi TaxID=2821407 RepID=A0ABS4BMV2_9HYPH|nr:tripartite tricarboxylate transporter TctB family protein [Jiella mangrovi]MBP0618029.1 tripartite tricarboxylate transporter TctB family protein [Jiella mangrovi]